VWKGAGQFARPPWGGGKEGEITFRAEKTVGGKNAHRFLETKRTSSQRRGGMTRSLKLVLEKKKMAKKAASAPQGRYPKFPILVQKLGRINSHGGRRFRTLLKAKTILQTKRKESWHQVGGRGGHGGTILPQSNSLKKHQRAHHLSWGRRV